MLHHISKREKLIVMLAVMSGLFLVALDQTIISTALVAILGEFESYSSLGFIITAYLLTSTVAVPIAGKLSDMYGRKLMLLIGVGVFTMGSLLSGAAPSVEVLIAARALQGIGGGIIMANAFTIIGDLFTPRERGRWQGIIGAVFGLSSLVGPLLGGWLTDGQSFLGLTTDWRWTFFINIPIGIAAALVIAKYCPKTNSDRTHRPDYYGAVFLAAALSAVVLSVDNTEAIFAGLIAQGVSLALIRGVLVAVAVLATGAFIMAERRAREPIIPLRFFRISTFSLIVVAALLFGAAFLGGILYLTQFNQQVFGASASEAGMMLLPMMGGMMVSSIVVGQVIARTGRYKRFMMVGFGIAAIGMLALVSLQVDSPYIQEALIIAVIGLGMGMSMPVLSVAVQNEFAQKDLGAATASVQLFRGLGSTVGTAVLSGILTAGVVANVGPPQGLPFVQRIGALPIDGKTSGDEITTDSLLQLNTQKYEIRTQAIQGIESSQMPDTQKQAEISGFKRDQDDFSRQVTSAFATSLHRVFVVSAVLMVLALALVSFLRERELRR